MVPILSLLCRNLYLICPVPVSFWKPCSVSNEDKVRGLWSVIIFIWETGGGGCSTFVSPFRDSSLSSWVVMSTRLSLSVGDGTSKNKSYLSLSTHDMSRRRITVELVSWADMSKCLVEMLSFGEIPKEMTGQGKVRLWLVSEWI